MEAVARLPATVSGKSGRQMTQNVHEAMRFDTMSDRSSLMAFSGHRPTKNQTDRYESTGLTSSP